MTRDLDERIVAAEQQLMARQQRLRREWTALGDQVTAALRPRQMMVPAAGLAAALMAMRQLRRPSAATAKGLGWLQLAGLVWPLLPQRWRAKVPTPLVEVAALAAPLLAQLMGRRGSKAAS
jgi:apolipoprotein D and lipocalin family protein